MTERFPLHVLQAIEAEFGTSTDQGRKARIDAEILLTQYCLSPEKWSEEAFRRMAQEKRWEVLTYNHRWSIFKRLLRRLNRLPNDSSSYTPRVEPSRRPSDLIMDSVPPAPEADNEPKSVAVNPTAEWSWEGNVQKALVAYLKGDGWAIEAEADTASGQHGPDVMARKSDTLLLVEVKGFPSTAYVRGERAGQPKPTKPSLQAHHWFSGALTTTILRKGDFPQAQLAMALPETRTYSMLIERSTWALKALNIWTFLVAQDGSVRLSKGSSAADRAPADPPSLSMTESESTPWLKKIASRLSNGHCSSR